MSRTIRKHNHWEQARLEREQTRQSNRDFTPRRRSRENNQDSDTRWTAPGGVFVGAGVFPAGQC